MFEAHLDLNNDINISKFEKILEEIKVLLDKYNINHTTIQPEFTVDDNKQIIH